MTQDLYQRTIKFAALKHSETNQIIPGTNIPYVVHLSNVAMELMIANSKINNFNLDYALQLALLHDVLEDTTTNYQEIVQEFGIEVAMGVKALTKNNSLPKEERMIDSILRIKKLSKEVGIVKLADRITNLQSPPDFWNKSKRTNYRDEAIFILKELNAINQYLENRLSLKIQEYEQYII